MSYTGRIIVSIQGLTLSPVEQQIIAHPMIAGVILFARNFNNLQQLKLLIQAIQNCALAAGKLAGLPIFVDQEGGAVQRFTQGFTSPLPALEVLGTAYDQDPQVGINLSKIYGYRMAQPLAAIGLISLAPVLDLATGNQVITGLGRAFHRDPEICKILAEAYIDGMQAAGMLATGKHFPGHGQDIGDSHLTTPIDPRTLTEIVSNDLSPFLYLISKQKLAAIMPAHITYPKVDPNNIVGMSKIWLYDLLRNTYKFDGIIISDCLTMIGAGTNSLLDKIQAALAYCDMVLLCNLDHSEEYLEILANLDQSQFQISAQILARFKKWVDPVKHKCSSGEPFHPL